MRSLGRLVAIALVASTLTTAALLPSAAGNTSTTPTTAAGYGVRWLTAQLDPGGFVPGPGGTVNVTNTVETALALAAAGAEGDRFDDIVAWLAAHVEDVVAPGGVDSPGAMGELLLVVAVAGEDPTSFGGVDLTARLDATLGLHTPGLYGAADPSFDGVYRQSFALLGLVAVGVTPPGSAVAWLADQQCDGAVPAATGGFQPFRADPGTQPCDAPDPNAFLGPDTNSTALAAQALVATGGFAGLGDALSFLDGAQTADGGIPFLPGLDPDPNSTALTIQAVIAGGEDPTAGRWATGSGDLVSATLAWQIGCDGAEADRGGVASPFSGGAPDQFATQQAVWGLSSQAFPLAAPSFAPAPVPCAVAADPPPDPASPAGPTAPAAAPTSTPAVAATPVAATPPLVG